MIFHVNLLICDILQWWEKKDKKKTSHKNDNVTIQVEGAKVISTDDEKVIKLSNEDFSALVRYLQKDSDSLPEDEEND